MARLLTQPTHYWKELVFYKIILLLGLLILSKGDVEQVLRDAQKMTDELVIDLLKEEVDVRGGVGDEGEGCRIDI